MLRRTWHVLTYGQKASDCVPSSFCNFLLWWDQQGLLPIGKRGDFDDKAEWIHTRMARFCRTSNNGGTSQHLLQPRPDMLRDDLLALRRRMDAVILVQLRVPAHAF